MAFYHHYQITGAQNWPPRCSCAFPLSVLAVKLQIYGHEPGINRLSSSRKPAPASLLLRQPIYDMSLCFITSNLRAVFLVRL